MLPVKDARSDQEAGDWEEDWKSHSGEREEAGEWEEDWKSSGGDKEAAGEWQEDWQSEAGEWPSSVSDSGWTSATATTLQWSAPASSSDGPWLGGNGHPVRADFLGKPLAKPLVEQACGKCGNIVEPMAKGVRLMKKSPAVWMCRVCNNRTSSLSSFFSGWPLEGFKDLSQAEQQQFWLDVGAAMGPDGIKKVVETSIFVRQVRRTINAARGEYQPIKHWVRLGYDGAYIRRSNQGEWNRDLGEMCYRVRIHHEDEEFVLERAKQLMQTALRGSKAEKRPRAPEVEPEEPAVEEEDAEPAPEPDAEPGPSQPSTQDSSTTTTTSSSDPSPPPKKDKKDKKDKKHKKETADPRKATMD